MASDNKREITICIDMGMTGSVARWRDSSKAHLDWTATSTKKIPTKLAYDPQKSGGRPIAWGGECDGLPPGQIKECFKAYMDATTFTIGPNTMPGAPGSRLELHRWVYDYLRAFCTSVLDRINVRGASFVWNFTVPGSWAVFPVATDFTVLAKDAVEACLPNAKDICVSTNVTEATASALCLMVGSPVRDHQYSVGSTVISCDIGGATTDVAVSTVSSAGTLTTWPQLGTESVGTVTVEKAFWLHAREALRSAGAPNHDQLALEMVSSIRFLDALENFTIQQREHRINIKLPWSANTWKELPPETPATDMSIVEHGYLSIHRRVFESFFMELAQHIEAAIDEAINTAVEKGKQPTVIGFCGGGCRISYLVKRLERRYGDTMSTTYLSNEPEMATVIGSTLMWERTNLRKFISQTSFGIETHDGIKWRSPEKRLVPSEFSRAYPWFVNFNCSKRGKTSTHRIIAATSIASLPNSFSDALLLPNSKSWTIQVDLRNENAAILSWNKMYQISCNISSPWAINFKAESYAAGKALPCVVTREDNPMREQP